MYTHSRPSDNDFVRSYRDVEEIVECFLSIDIDTQINESSISKKYKWITSLELISADEFKQIKFLKQRNPKQQQTVKHFQIDKFLYLVVIFCEEGKVPIARIRTRKQFQDSQWKIVPYPKQFQGFYQHYICYQYTQSKQCKRIITDIEVCHSKQLQNMGKTQDQWQIATIPQICYRQSKPQRPTLSESQQSVQRKSNPFNFPQLDSKFSDHSQMRQNNSNLSENSYYSCNDNDNQSYSKSSIQKDNFSDLDDRSPSHQSYDMQSKKSSLSQFHSIQQTGGPFYFLMKTIDLYDNHNQFQYTYQPKIVQINKAYSNSTIEEKWLRSLTKFCFPNGIKLSKKISGCGFQTFTLILTTDEGQRYFAYCLKYKQKMTLQAQKALLKELYELHLIDKDEIYKNQSTYNEKAFCLVSKIQNTDAFHKILQNLYRALLSFISPQKGVEYFPNKYGQRKQRDLQFFAKDLIQNLQVFGKNLLRKQRKNIIDPLKAIPIFSERNHTLEFKWCGVNASFPKKQSENKVSMKAMYCLFKLLSVDNILKILQAALLQKKIFIVSCIQTSILLVIQALVGLIHPLRLSQPIIPIISADLLDLIEAPIPLVAGIGQEYVNQNTLTKAVYAFLDCNKILALQELPNFPIPVSKLSKQLKKIQLFNPEHVIEYLNFKDEVYSLGIHQIEEYTHQIHEQIKTLFKDNTLSIIRNYSSFYSKTVQENIKSEKQSHLKTNKEVQSERPYKSKQIHEKSRKHMTFKQMYNPTLFIKEHEKKEYPFYHEFCKSSIFKNLIQQKYINPESEDIKLIDNGIQHLDQKIINHFSCFSIPVSSLKKQSHEINFNGISFPKQKTAVKPKTNFHQKKIQERGSLTNIKDQTMKKHLSTIEQETHAKRNIMQQRKATNIPHVPQVKNHLRKQKAKLAESEDLPSQRLSQGAVYQKEELRRSSQKQSQENQSENQQKSVGFRICSMVNNVTKKFTESKTNIINIFSEAKVNRLKKVFFEENKQKIAIQKKNQIEENQKSENLFFHQTAPELLKNKKNQINGKIENKHLTKK